MGIATINPFTGETVRTFEALSDEAIAQKLTVAQAAFESYRQIPLAQRADWLKAAAAILLAEKETFGALMTVEMGKPLAAAIAEVEKSAWVCRYYAEQGAEFLTPEAVTTDASQSYIRYDPLGVILAVMPWNFPFWQVFRFAAPALMAGNVGILKHASNVPQSALAIESILTRAGFPAGVFQTLLVGADQVGAILADRRVMAATLTGSEPAGMSLASQAGHLIKKTVLELGGSDPFIVLASADVAAAATAAVTSRLINNGQSCIAAKRFIVQEAIAAEFAERMVAQFAALKLGDPMQPETTVGPLATRAILDELDQQVQTCIAAGAKVLIGGDRGAIAADPQLANGYFYPPTILTDIPGGAPAYQQEFFGPVALLFRVPDLEAAIQLANSTSFGLGASAWTGVAEEGDRLIAELEAGAVFINGLVKSDPRLPFGGIKRSGYGRELGRHGLYEFVNIKSVWVK